ncbi:MAG: hypothetical protein ACKVS5_04300 [Parvularculaceae bacterium]
MPLASSVLSSLFLSSPSKPAALYAGRAVGLNSLRCFAQGLGSALVAYTGATNAASPGAAPVATDFTSLDAFTLAVLDGRLTGPAQLLGAVALFLTAGQSTARVLGLLVGMTLVYFHMQGLTLRDALVFAGDEVRRFADAIEASRAVETAQ